MESSKRPAAKIMEIGPHQTDLRECRPYFLVPIMDIADREILPTLCRRIAATAQQLEAAGKPVTDLYILSHGWHRNFYSGVGAYDRLVSRLAALLHRQRLKPPEPYSPLFITLHWHSDPGQDNWVDPAGRRDKVSFMTNARAAFRPGIDPNTKTTTTEAVFANDFENIYELFSSVSAPDTAILDSKYNASATIGWQRLAAYRFRESDDTLPDAPLNEKTAMIWRCYNEAQPRGLLLDQADLPKPYNSLMEALSTLFKFVLSTVGAAALAGFVLSNRAIGLSWITEMWTRTLGLPMLQPLWNRYVQPAIWSLQSLSPWLKLPLILMICLLILLFTASRRKAKKESCIRDGHQTEGHQARGVPIITLLAWLPLQIACALPMLVWALVGYLLGGLSSLPFTAAGKRSPYVFDERYGSEDRRRTVRDVLAGLARGPLALLKASLPRDSSVMGIADSIDNQLAFWEMQRKGVDAGKQAGELLTEMLGDTSFHNVRVHLIGHSFGCLVVANAARFLAEEKAANRLQNAKLQSVCLVQGALATDWFVGETTLMSQIEGRLACIYSGYDTANGFYYPLSNNGRMAAGFVGLYRVGENAVPLTLGEGGLFASLAEPPNLTGEIAKESHRTGIPWRHALSLDASRLIYYGPPAAGGGHDDIFKDDVIHLLWAVTAA